MIRATGLAAVNVCGEQAEEGYFVHQGELKEQEECR